MNWIEFDAYLRPVLSLGHCRFKGGGSTTTVQKREIPEQSANEAALEAALMQYATTNMGLLNGTSGSSVYEVNPAYTEYQKKVDAINRKYGSSTGDESGSGSAISGSYANDAARQREIAALGEAPSPYLSQTGGTNGIYDKLSDAMNNVVDFDWQNLYNQFMRENSQSLSDYQRDSKRYLDAYNSSSQNALSDFSRAANNYLNNYTGKTNAATDAYGRDLAQSTNAYNQAANTYAANQQNALATLQNALNTTNTQAQNAANAQSSARNAALNSYSATLDSLGREAQQAASAQAAARNAAQAGYEKSLGAADALASKYTDEYRTYGQSLLDEMNRQAAAQNGAYDELLRGNLPSAYSQARQQALNVDLKQTMGNAIANLANRGIVNSSVSNTALNDITRNASDTLARNYTSDLLTAADIIDRSRENSNSTYSSRSNLAKDLYGAGISYADRLGDTAGKVYSGNISNADTAYNSAMQGIDYRTGNANNVYTGRVNNADTAYNSAMNNVNLGVNNAKDIYGSATGTYQSILSAAQQAAQNAAANAASRYGSLIDSANSIYGAQNAYNSQLYGNRLDAANQLYNNQTGAANTLLQNRQLTNQNALLGAIQAQSSSYAPMLNYMDMASQLAAPATNLYNTMYSGRMGSGTVTTTTSGGSGKGSTAGGIASGVGSVGSALIACFTGETLVTTPDGYKEIQDIKPGDIVLSVRDGEVVPKAVKEVLAPHKAQIVNVYFDNGTVWHTTPSQRYFDGKHFNFIECAMTSAMVRGGKPSEILTYEFTGEEKWVYDFTVNGSAADNVYFANDVAAEGFGE